MRTRKVHYFRRFMFAFPMELALTFGWLRSSVLYWSAARSRNRKEAGANTMKRSGMLVILIPLAAMIAAHAYGKGLGSGNWFGSGKGPSSRGVQTPDPAEVKDVPVYVTNFQLDVAPAQPAPRPAQANSNPRGKPPIEPPDPHKLAGYVVDLMASKLVAALRREGYAAQRLGTDDERPSSGVEIRGIFTEVDEENHWRRAVIRSGEDTGKMNAIVAVQNLARPDQTLYEIAPLPGNEDKPGAVITLSSYVPLQRYEVDKDGTEDMFAKVAARVVSDLTELLVRNPGSVQE